MLKVRRASTDTLVAVLNHLHDLVIRILFRSYQGSVSGHRLLASTPVG